MKFCSRMLALVIATGAASVAAGAQNAVTSRLDLTREEWRCLQPRLDQYLRDSLDPVLATVLGCGQQAAPGAMWRQDPRIPPPLSNGGDADAKRKVFYLTKPQIVCLKGVISSLIKKSGGDAHGLIAYDLSGCQAAAH